MYCPKCGNSLDNDAKYCTECGKNIPQNREIKITPSVPSKSNKPKSTHIIGVENTDFIFNESEIYLERFNVSRLSDEQMVQFKNHKFVTKLHPIIPVLLNYTLIGLIVFFIYYLSLHSKLPKVNKTRDVSGVKAVGFCFIPIYNAFYWYHSVWQRLIERLNFQHKLRNSPYRISYDTGGFTTVLGIIPYLNLLSIFIFGPILFWKVQTSINRLIDIDSGLRYPNN